MRHACSLPLSVISAVAALLAGGLWFISAFVTVPDVVTKAFWGHGNPGMQRIVDALRRQARWSVAADLAATVAAVAQGMDTLCR